jgi:hypothetical protein
MKADKTAAQYDQGDDFRYGRGAVFVFGIGLMADGGRNVSAEKKTLLVFLRRF